MLSRHRVFALVSVGLLGSLLLAGDALARHRVGFRGFFGHLLERVVGIEERVVGIEERVADIEESDEALRDRRAPQRPRAGSREDARRARLDARAARGGNGPSAVRS